MNDEKNIDTVLQLSKEEVIELLKEFSLSDIENLYDVINGVGNDD